MSEVKNKLIEAAKAGEFLSEVYNLAVQQRGEREAVAEELVSLHNHGQIDVVSEFGNLKNSEGSDFFLTRNIFEAALPKIINPVKPTMDCVLKLVDEAGEDLMAGHILSTFIEFCAADPIRFDEALDVIKLSPVKYNGMIPPVMIGGTQFETDRFLGEIATFSKSHDFRIRSSAFFSLAKIKYPEEKKSSTIFAMDCLLDGIEGESEDRVLANIIKAASSICMANATLNGEAVGCINSALDAGGDFTLHAVSEALMLNGEKLPAEVFDVCLKRLPEANPNNKGTIDNIDHVLASLLKCPDPEKGISLLESLLLKHPKDLSLKAFDSTIHSILQSDKSLLDKLLGSWFSRGDHALCNGIRVIVETTHGESLMPEVDEKSLGRIEFPYLVFTARKAIGYLFNSPLACASIIVSLIKLAKDQQSIQDLASLLFDPILINYSGETYQFLKSKEKIETGKAKSAIRSSIESFDNYLENLRSVTDLPELLPSQSQREASLRHFNRLMSDSFKEAMKDSIFHQICSKAVLLYGTSSISHIREGSGKSRRMETPMQSHGTSIDVPRLASLDPIGLDYTLRVFRNERLKSS